MATFSFGKFFGKHPRQPRFRPELTMGGSEAREGGETLPVGRLVSFTDDGPEDAPLFQEFDGPAGSPFVVVGGTRPSTGSGGLPGPSRTALEEGFTADELTAMVPARWARPGAVPGTQVIPLPHQVLRASLGAGQPAVLLSQLHQACPELFVAPSSLDDDLVIALPPQKVQRLVARVEPDLIPGSAGVIPPPRPARDLMEPLAWTAPVGLTDQDEVEGQAFAEALSKVKLPPPRRKFDDMHGGDLRPLMERPTPPAPSDGFLDLGTASTMGLPADDLAAGFSSPFLKAESAYRPAAGSPFQVASALPHGFPDRGGGLPKRFDSPFAIVSPGEVPAVLESPFARHPITGLDVPPADELPNLEPEPPRTVSLALTALLQGQTAEGLGFAPERVPASVRVTLAAAPLLSQVATGRIRVSLAEVVDGLDAKFQPAFKQARSGLDLVVPMRELFDNLPEASLPTPVAPPIATTIATPFSIRAEEDHPLTAVNSPFQIASPMPASGPEVLPPPPTVVPLPMPAATTIPLLPPPITDTAPSFELPPMVARMDSPFIVIPDATVPSAPVGLSGETIAPPPFLMVPEEFSAIKPAEAPWASSPLPTTTPVAVVPTSEALLPPEEPPAAPAAAPEPAPLRNPFTFAPGEGLRGSLGLELSYLPYDEEPVPLESLRETEATEATGHVALEQPNLLPELPAVLWPSAAAPVLVPSPPAPEVSAAPAPPSPVLPPPVYRWALSEQEPLPPPPSAAADILPAVPSVEPPSAPESFLPSAPPQPAWSAAPTMESPPASERAEAHPSVPSAENHPGATAPLSPTADDRAAFAFVFAPSALNTPSDDGRTPLGAMDSMPAIALAKLPPLGEEPAAPPPTSPFLVPPTALRETPQPVTWSATPIQETPPLSTAPAVSLEPPPTPEPPLAWTAAPKPAADPATIEDLSFGYVDNPTQLALRAVFATGKTLDTQEVVDLAARLDGLRACLVHTPHASLQSAAAPDDTEEVRHFRERAASLFEKTASLVRELDPTAREQSFTLRTGKGVVSFFAIDDVCLAVLHGEPSFRPGVREKLTLVVRSVADMLAA